MANYNEEDNHRIGRDLARRDMDQNPQPERYSYRPRNKDRKWDEGNFFHTGPSQRGAQDRENLNRNTNRPAQHSTYNRNEGAHLNDHYGSRPNSAYRNERSYLNHGDSFRSDNYSSRPQSSSGSVPGNYNEPPTRPYELWNDVPGGRSRYKEDDYRYGSGSHNWYTEGRYTPDVEPVRRDNRGFFDRVKDTWNDIWHSDDPDYHPRTQNRSQSEQISSRHRYGGEQYRDRNFDRGYEGGPRWADEVDSGKDNYYDDTDRTQRYRR